MEQRLSTREQRPAWFVGAAFGGDRDQTDRFLADGIWENGYADRYLDDVRSIRLGDRIAIKQRTCRSMTCRSPATDRRSP